LDYDLPKASLAVPHALLLGKIFTVVYTILYPWLNRWWLPQPFILPAEVHKVRCIFLAEYNLGSYMGSLLHALRLSQTEFQFLHSHQALVFISFYFAPQGKGCFSFNMKIDFFLFFWVRSDLS
jgi:hypothetical protein